MDIKAEQNLLNSLGNISAAASASGPCFNNPAEAQQDIEAVSSFLGITGIQAILLSCITELSLQKTVTLDILAKHLKTTILKLLVHMGDLEELEKKGYIKKTLKKKGNAPAWNDIGFTIPFNLVEGLRKADLSLVTSVSKHDLPSFLRQVSNLINEREYNGMPTAQMISETEFLISTSRDLSFVSYIDNALALTISKVLAFGMGYVKLKGQMFNNLDGIASALFDDLGEQLGFAQAVASGNHELVLSGIITTEISEFGGDTGVAFTESTLKELYLDYPSLLVTIRNDSNLISWKSLTRKTLYFSDEVNTQIVCLRQVMNAGRFKKYKQELKRNKLTGGMTAIFHGAPGTGKTELVNQLAIASGRNIMMVDLSQTKNKWFGDSEKQVRKIFDDYSQVLRNSEVEPILFINEADGLFTRRISMETGRNTSSDQAINTMQNILLQGLENFEGILIATTNLTSNLDKAFERRFTFKVCFPKPGADVRLRIWKSKLPSLSTVQATILAEKFELSGGEIDIQVRQLLLKKVLNRKVDIFESLMESCSNERGFDSRKRVGF